MSLSHWKRLAQRKTDITKPRNSETKHRNTETAKHRNETPKHPRFFSVFFLDQRNSKKNNSFQYQYFKEEIEEIF